jgi:hypothetical protein
MDYPHSVANEWFTMRALQTLQDLAHIAQRLPGLGEIIETEARLYLATFET